MPLKKGFPLEEITSCLQNLLQNGAKNKTKKIPQTQSAVFSCTK